MITLEDLKPYYKLPTPDKLEKHSKRLFFNFPADTAFNIIKHLDPLAIDSCSLVSKSWKFVTDYQIICIKVDLLNKIFNFKDWEDTFPKVVQIPDEEKKEALNALSYKITPEFLKKNAVAFIPKNFSLPSLETLLKREDLKMLSYLEPTVKKKNYININFSWKSMSKSIEGTTMQTFDEQEGDFKENQEVPFCLGVAIIMMGAKIKFNEEYFVNSYTRCMDNVLVSYGAGGILITDAIMTDRKLPDVGMATYMTP